VAAGGYDVVSYFADNAPRPGNPRIVARHGGAEYRFATLAHRERFLANPQSYLPQFGGHCAYGMGKGKLLTGDPQSWLVHKGKLYLLSSREALAAFQANLAVAIEQADRIWKRLY
jgi:hemin uptake protein HemP